MCNYIYEISIIIPTHHPQEYIYECLLSIKNQILTKELFEILIILNGEKEPYYRNIKKYIYTEFFDYNISLFYTKIKGVSNARNIGLEHSKGRYITFIDDDDVVSSHYLLMMYNVAKRDILPLTYIKVFDNDIATAKDYYFTNIYNKRMHRRLSLLNVRSYFSFSYCKMIDKDIIGGRRFNTNFQNGEDGLFMFLISDKIKDIEFTGKEAVYYRRIRNGSLVTKKRSIMSVIKNSYFLIITYSKIYLKTPYKYHFFFYFTRVLATFKSLCLYFIQKPY
ncbi:MAG: glycosyltransferase [Bacteroidales bacterium]|jgi:glycosyltransferase involved in cell wall biosynthesis|nr:glycosyltransferase [Bacteroidales bacterium]